LIGALVKALVDVLEVFAIVGFGLFVLRFRFCFKVSIQSCLAARWKGLTLPFEPGVATVLAVSRLFFLFVVA